MKEVLYFKNTRVFNEFKNEIRNVPVAIKRLEGIGRGILVGIEYNLEDKELIKWAVHRSKTAREINTTEYIALFAVVVVLTYIMVSAVWLFLLFIFGKI